MPSCLFGASLLLGSESTAEARLARQSVTANTASPKRPGAGRARRPPAALEDQGSEARCFQACTFPFAGSRCRAHAGAMGQATISNDHRAGPVKANP